MSGRGPDAGYRLSEELARALREGDDGAARAALRALIDTGGWRRRLGEPDPVCGMASTYRCDSFARFLTQPWPEGLGTTIERLRAACAADEPLSAEVEDLLRENRLRVKRADSRLGRLQRDILARLWRYTDHVRRNGNDFARDELAAWGVPLRRLRPRDEEYCFGRADSAAFSRAVRQLVRRGLVARRNQRNDSDRRASHLLLSETGEAIARRICQEESARNG